jgi:hypothetical protein
LCSNFGAAWNFTRSSGTWTQQGPKLTPNDKVGGGYFGYGMALSADGATVLIGGPFDNNVGAAGVFGPALVESPEIQPYVDSNRHRKALRPRRARFRAMNYGPPQ